MPPWHSIKWRVFFYYSLLILLTVGLLNHLFYNFERNSQIRLTAMEMNLEGVRILPLFIANPGRERRSSNRSRQLTQLQKTEEAGSFIYFFGTGGDVEYASDHAPDPAELNLPAISPRPSQQFLQRGDFILMLHDHPRSQRIVIGRDRRELDKMVRAELFQVLLWSGGVALAACSFGFLMLHVSLHPLSQISAAAERIARGNLQERVSTRDPNSEVGQLTRVLNNTFDRLEDTLNRQVRFTADASHELRTPVAAMLADCQFSLKKERPSERYRETIEVCHSSAQHMRALIQDLSQLASFDGNSAELVFEPLDLRDVLRRCLDITKPLAETHQLTLESDLFPAWTLGDDRRLSQSFINLLSNAVRYNRPEGKVVARCGLHSKNGASQVYVEIQDTGIGIPSDQLDKVFDRFHRVDPSRSQKTGGSGLGLAITQSIIRAHGGRIILTSELNKGSCFRVELPVYDFARQNVA